MAEWYDLNEVNANANEVAVDANANANANEVAVAVAVVDANVNANANANANAVAVDANKYRCDCGCNLEFIDYEPGFDVYVGNTWLITANAMVNYSWRDYIQVNEFKLWKDFREDIILNYNHALNNEEVKSEDAPWIHLYHREVAQGNNIPLNEQLYYEYAY
jgi:hypothetical protein